MMLFEADDEELMRKLERARKGRRDDYPVRVCWNVLLAGMVLEARPESGNTDRIGKWDAAKPPIQCVLRSLVFAS
ncbi:MAG: hypothetical protein ABIF82_00665 [Planctomycetota bacterium]